MINEWIDIPGYEGKYQVSDGGDIMSLNYRRTGENKLMTPGVDKDGYRYVCLMADGKRRYFKVHRLVWEAFVGPIPDGYEINHLNELKNDNRLENLEAVQHKSNINHGTCSERAGRRHHKPIIQYDLEGNIIREWGSMTEVKKKLGIDPGQVSACCKEKPHYNTAGGFKWKYKKTGTD